MKALIAILFTFLLSGFAHALPWESLKTANTSSTWLRVSVSSKTGERFFTGRLIPMSEAVADTIQSLNPSMTYDCEAKMYETSPVISPRTINVYQLKNCQSE